MSQNSHKYNHFEGFAESLMTQFLQQRITFEPRNLFSFDMKLIITCVAFAVTYDAVFIQFYYL